MHFTWYILYIISYSLYQLFCCNNYHKLHCLKLLSAQLFTYYNHLSVTSFCGSGIQTLLTYMLHLRGLSQGWVKVLPRPGVLLESLGVEGPLQAHVVVGRAQVQQVDGEPPFLAAWSLPPAPQHAGLSVGQLEGWLRASSKPAGESGAQCARRKRRSGIPSPQLYSVGQEQIIGPAHTQGDHWGPSQSHSLQTSCEVGFIPAGSEGSGIRKLLRSWLVSGGFESEPGPFCFCCLFGRVFYTAKSVP